MSKDPDEDQKRVRIKAGDFTEENYSWIRAGMAVAISRDFHKFSIEVAKKCKYETRWDFDVDFLDKSFDSGEICQLINLSIKCLRDDERWCQETGYPSFSHWHGIECAQKMYEVKRMGEGGSIDLLSGWIHASQVALILRGFHDMALDIYRIAGALNAWSENENGGFFEKIPHMHLEFRILEYLRGLLVRGEIPTQEKIRIDLSKGVNGLDKSMLSRILKNMEVKYMIPVASNAGGRSKNPSKSFYISESGYRRAEEVDAEEVDAEEFDAEEGGCVKFDGTTGDYVNCDAMDLSKMEDVHIREIKEGLGVLYDFILLMTGMDDLEDWRDVEEFKKVLSRVGLKWVGIQGS